MQCVKPITLPENGLRVPCGKCIACRLQRSREWTVRMLHERSAHEYACFITLTYDEEHCPKNNTLRKKDLQLFFKKLRKSIHPRKIRYYACGEYGEKRGRPHYHAVLFGIHPGEKKLIQDNWLHGSIHVGNAEYDSMMYVAGYVMKKYTGPMAQSEYIEKGIEPVFQTCSLGIGKDWMYANEEYLRQNLGCTVHGAPVGLPRYYRKKLEIDAEAIQSRAEQEQVKLHMRLIDLGIEPLALYDHFFKVRKQREENMKAKAVLYGNRSKVEGF